MPSTRAGPAQVLGIAAGRLRAGQPAHLTLIDPELKWTLRSAELRSAGHCTPFDGQAFRGRCVTTLHGGKIVHGTARGA